MQDIKQLNEEAVESEKEKVAGQFTEAFTAPRTVGSKDGAGRFGKNRAGYGGEKSGEEKTARSLPVGKGVDCLLDGREVSIGEVKSDRD